MLASASPDCDVTFIVRTLDDEERIGHIVGRIARYLAEHKLSAEILVADEGSGDNTVAVAVMLRRKIREIVVLHAAPDCGFRDASARARGRFLVLADARCDAPLAPLGFALGRLQDGIDVVSVSGRYLAVRRTRAWRAFDALAARREDAPELSMQRIERRFLRRARRLGLACSVIPVKERPAWWRSFRPLRPVDA